MTAAWVIATLAGGLALGLASLASITQGPAAPQPSTTAAACAKASTMDELDNIF